eukprot:2646734-Amphidinium_carterae.1
MVCPLPSRSAFDAFDPKLTLPYPANCISSSHTQRRCVHCRADRPDSVWNAEAIEVAPLIASGKCHVSLKHEWGVMIGLRTTEWWKRMRKNLATPSEPCQVHTGHGELARQEFLFQTLTPVLPLKGSIFWGRCQFDCHWPSRRGIVRDARSEKQRQRRVFLVSCFMLAILSDSNECPWATSDLSCSRWLRNAN